MSYPPISKFKKLFIFEEETGRFFWKVKTLRPQQQIGDEAGYTFPNGYRVLIVERRRYYVHRVVWAWISGDWPKEQIDHINGNRNDNRPENLREASAKQNGCNRGKTILSTSGFKGVTWHKKDNKWQAQIGVDGRYKYIGQFASKEAAAEAYERVAREFHGEFARSE